MIVELPNIISSQEEIIKRVTHHHRSLSLGIPGPRERDAKKKKGSNYINNRIKKEARCVRHPRYPNATREDDLLSTVDPTLTG